MADPQQLVERWLQDCVLGLELCPFAAPVVREQSLRIAVSEAAQAEQQLQDFLLELDRLQCASEEEISTSLLVFAQGPADFEEFLDLVDQAQGLLEAAELEGIVQIAHFHPRYLFADEPVDGVTHYTNRSPLPIIHLLREAMLSRVLETFPHAEQIPQRNIERLVNMGRQEIEQRWRSLLRP